MIAALDNFGNLKDSGKVAILGDMFELGKDTAIEHQSIADYSQKFNIEHIYLVGENFFKTETNANNVTRFQSFKDLKNELLSLTLKNKYVLIKGSRGMALERVLDFVD